MLEYRRNTSQTCKMRYPCTVDVYQQEEMGTYHMCFARISSYSLAKKMQTFQFFVTALSHHAMSLEASLPGQIICLNDCTNHSHEETANMYMCKWAESVHDSRFKESHYVCGTIFSGCGSRSHSFT